MCCIPPLSERCWLILAVRSGLVCGPGAKLEYCRPNDAELMGGLKQDASVF